MQMPFPLNPRVVRKLGALPDGPEKQFLQDLMKYEIEKHSGEKAERRFTQHILELVERYTGQSGEKP
jgi:hypothetical protein